MEWDRIIPLYTLLQLLKHLNKWFIFSVLYFLCENEALRSWKMTTLQEEDDFGAAEVRRRQDVARKLRLQVVLVLIIMKNIINIE